MESEPTPGPTASPAPAASPGPRALLRAAEDDGRRLLTVAETGWGHPVPHCPAWDAAELVRHTGGVLGWMSAVVTSGGHVSRRSLDPPPASVSDLPAWYLAALDRTLEVLASADPDAEIWTFSSRGDSQVKWWWRRLAAEVAIHRFDAEHAAAERDGPPPGPLDGEVAGAGIDEFVVEFLPGLIARDGVEGLGGSLHLHATDGPTEWWIDLDDGGAARREHGKADTALRGTRSQLLLWLMNRAAPETLEVFGDRTTLRAWSQLRL